MGHGPWWVALSRLTTASAPPVLQLAADGRWEDATVLSVPSTDSQLRAALEPVAATARTDVAVEVLWPGQAFVGARWPVPLWQEAVSAGARAVAALSDQAAGGLARALVAMLDAEPAAAVEKVELGRVNAWLSSRPEVLYRQGDPGGVRVPAAVLAARPDLRTSPVPVALELAVTTPQWCWAGINVSVPCGHTHVVQEGAMSTVLRAVGLMARTEGGCKP